MSKKITNFMDLIYLRDVIARFEELDTKRKYLIDALDKAQGVVDIATARSEFGMWINGDEGQEFNALRQLLVDCEGNGGDEQWRGDWYPIELIRCTYFKEYAQELAEECGMIQRDLKWPYTCIDWDSAARELLMDYTTISFNGVNYHCR
jgi:hypothetical protein